MLDSLGGPEEIIPLASEVACIFEICFWGRRIGRGEKFGFRGFLGLLW